VAVRRRDKSRFVLLAALVVLNIAAVTYGSWDIAYGDRGFEPVLLNGGYITDAMLAFGVLVAIGVSALIKLASPPPSKGRRRNQEQTPAPVLVAIGLALALVVPSAVVHFRYDDHRGPPLADLYGKRVLDALPAKAVLFTWGTEFAAPARYRQEVFGERRDVTVVAGPEMTLEWYRQQISRILGTAIAPPTSTDPTAYVVNVINQLQGREVLYLDAQAMHELNGKVSFRSHGLVGAVEPQGAATSVSELNTATAALYASDRADGVSNLDGVKFPNDSVYFFHELAHIELAKGYASQNDLAAAATELSRAADVWPYAAAQLRQVSQLAARGDPSAAASISQL
jgi:hypothetical protein